jgi:hypothetical protein
MAGDPNSGSNWGQTDSTGGNKKIFMWNIYANARYGQVGEAIHAGRLRIQFGSSPARLTSSCRSLNGQMSGGAERRSLKSAKKNLLLIPA